MAVVAKRLTQNFRRAFVAWQAADPREATGTNPRLAGAASNRSAKSKRDTPSNTRPHDSFRADLRDEFRRVFSWPWDDLITVAVNAVLVTALWFLLPLPVKNWLFAPQGPAAFAIVLETWMLADVPATNMIGKDVGTMVPALDDPARLQRLLQAKAIILALLVGIPSAAVSILIGIYDDSYMRGLLLACVVLVLPFGASSIAAWLGIVIPYRPLPLRWRWANRAPWRPTIRWVSLVIIPFVLVPIVSCLLLAPGILVGLAIGRDTDGRMSITATLAATLVTCALSTIAFLVGPRVSAYLATKHRERVRPLLAEPASDTQP